MMCNILQTLGEFGAAGLFEENGRSLFYRKALGLRRFYENCPLPPYNGEPLYPSGQVSMPPYINGLALDMEKISKTAPEISERIKDEFYKFSSFVPREHTVAGNMYTHSIPNYERILKEGFNSYLERIEKISDADIKEGLQHLIRGIENYINRITEFLQLSSADEKLISALRQVPMKPARNIYEAVVGWNFIMYLDGCDNLGCVASGLYPYYNGEDITELLKNLFDNIDVNCGYSMALHTDYNPLTLQCLEASKGKRRPMIELFVDENTPDEIWEKAFEVVESGNGQPAFYNPNALLCGLQNRFDDIADDDIRRFCGGGCTESMLAGLSNVGSLDAGINLLLILESVIYAHLESSKDFEDFYSNYIKEVEKTVRKVTSAISRSQELRAQVNPLPMRTLLIDDCIDKGLDFNNGGARYQWSIINFAGIINVIDSLLIISDYIFNLKNYTKSEFINKLKSNDTEFLLKARKHDKAFGNDNEYVNRFSYRLTHDIFSLLDDKKPYFGKGFLPASIQFMSQVTAGEPIGATPDGRKAGAPLCDSLGAIFSKDMSGPTALLNSVTALDLKRALGVPVLNFNFYKRFDKSVLKALILGYMKNGGIQLQISHASKNQLKKALMDPESYKNLIVRVGGYSEYFSRLSDELKNMVIERTVYE